MTPTILFPEVATYLEQRRLEFDSIAIERREQLEAVAQYVANRLQAQNEAKLTFVCTHNSRRSHLSQVWARVCADALGIAGIETYSGGTEATAFNPRAVDALQRAGLEISTDDPQAANPVYLVRSGPEGRAERCWSKVYDQPPNPTAGYCAVMTCSEADGACPVVPGCELRAAIRYEDPKVADGTDQEQARYSERSEQICREMLYLMNRISMMR